MENVILLVRAKNEEGSYLWVTTSIAGVGLGGLKSFFSSHSETLTKFISTGTSIGGPMTAANACPEAMPKTPTQTAIASSKLLLAAVNAMVAVSG